MMVVSCSEEGLVAAKEWLKSLPTQNMVAVDCGSDTVDEVHICEVEKAVANMKVPYSKRKDQCTVPYYSVRPPFLVYIQWCMYTCHVHVHVCIFMLQQFDLLHNLYHALHNLSIQGLCI